MTTPVTEESVTHVEVWSTIEQALMSEIGKVKDEHTRAMTRVFNVCEKLHENQKSQERQLTDCEASLSIMWNNFLIS